ncbi:MAG: ThiF family adenylyltransferase [Lentisphaerae bacterium]|nr:ThiF family adenylyltransferase [Lentisphaerota bacterium]
MSKLIIIGLGGIGGALAEPMARYMAHRKMESLQMLLVDGDRYEPKNADRQRVSCDEVGQHKSELWAKRMSRMFAALDVKSITGYVTPANIARIIQTGDTVMLCVDNHATRNLVQEHMLRLRDAVLISGGNDYTNGNVQVFVKRKGRVLTAPITKHHPEIENPADKRPDEIGCDDEIPDSPQLIFTNFTAAAVMMNAYHRLGNGTEPSYGEVYFDIDKNIARTVKRAA